MSLHSTAASNRIAHPRLVWLTPWPSTQADQLQGLGTLASRTGQSSHPPLTNAAQPRNPFRQEHARFEASHIRDFVPLLVEKRARHELKRSSN
jgi:hypothetical protein